MSTAAVARASFTSRDLIALAKPGILIFALMTTAGAMSLAPGTVEPSLWLPLFLGTGLIVASANALNMYLEREIDCYMSRTKKRPLPAGRMDPQVALVFGLIAVAISVPLLTFGVNALTGMCGVVAFISYVMFYTPMKQRTTMAVIVGSLPGAMPALMGWTAVTGRLDAGGLVIFGILFFWQIPHFHAISLFRSKEYTRAGLKVLPVESSPEFTRLAMVLYTAVQVQLSFMLYPLGVAGIWYVATAALLGGAYFVYSVVGLRNGNAKWAKRFFLFSIVYLPILFTVMVIDGVS
ncbi:MAG: protoheme IX farnesyltransferase [Myxococcales bacterium]|nr:protoheme IX farnesyltransferase [Myxococcales bacterium]